MAKMYMLKLSRSLLALILAVLNAGVAYAEVLIPYYIHPPQIAQATVIFVTAIGNAVAIYLSTEEQKAPG